MKELFIALASACLGFLFSMYKNRVRPWITLANFIQSTRNKDMIDNIKDLSTATKKTYFGSELPMGNCPLEKIKEHYNSSKNVITGLEAGINKVRAGIERLKEAKEDNDVFEAMSMILEPIVISETLKVAILKQDIKLPDYDSSIEIKINYEYAKEQHEGCFIFPTKTGYQYFGSLLNNQPFAKDKIAKFIGIIARLEKDKLTNISESLLGVSQDQLETSKKIRELSEPIVNENSRWLCGLFITNFGSSPFLLFSEEAVLVVQGGKVGPFRIKCRLVTKDANNWKENAEETIALLPGSSQSLGIVTKEVQKNISQGSVIRGAYQQGDCFARAEITYIGREIPWKRTLKTKSVTFKGD